MANDLIFPKTIMWDYVDQGHHYHILNTLEHELDDIISFLNDLILGI